MPDATSRELPGESERHRRERELFDAACDLDPAEQRALLDRECGAEAELRRRLEELLALDHAPEPRIEAAQIPWLGPGGARPLPERIGPYRILSELGRGGMGIVYRAEQESPRRTIALKVIGSGAFGQELLSRFEREARVLGWLNHPGIAQIHEAAVADTPEGPRPYLAMELVAGEPLVAFCDARRSSPRERLEILAKVCDAVEHAHQKGVIHRDLKPANVLVQPDGQPKVLDFGIARVVDPDLERSTRRTRADDLLGTLPYMSPEQLGGRPEDLDLRSDVYSLGVIAFELLTGSLPFDLAGRSLPAATRIVQESEPARLSAARRDLRGDVSTIVAKSLEKEKERRYSSAGALAGDLRRYLAHEPILARPPGGLYQLRKFARRNRGLTTGIALAFAALIAGTIVSLLQARRADGARDFAEGQRAEALRASRRATLGAASMASKIHDLSACERLLESIEPGERAWEWRHIAARLDTSAAHIRPGEPVRAAGFLPDASELLLVTASGELQRWSPDGLERLASIRLEDTIQGPAALSSDGRFLAGVFGSASEPAGQEVGLWELASGRRVARTPAEAPVATLAVAPDGSRVAYAGAKAWLWTPGSEEGSVGISGVRYTDFEFCSREDFLAGVDNQPGAGCVLLIDGSGQRTTRQVVVSGNHVHGVALNPDGSLIAAGTEEKRVELVDGREGTRLADLLGHRDRVRRVAFSADGARLASASDDGTVRLWDVARRSQTSVLSRLPAPSCELLFDPSGKRVLALTEDEAVLWSIDAEREGVLARLPSYGYGVAFLGGGARVLALSFDGILQMQDSHSGEILWRHAQGGHGKALCAAADGALFASGHGSQVFLRDGDAGELLRTLPCADTVIALSMSARGERLVVLTIRDAALLDPWTGKELGRWPLSSSSNLSDAALSPNGRHMAVADGRGDLLLWDLARSMEPLRFRAHAEAIEALAFSGDGSRLASGGADHAVRLWDAATGEGLWTAEGHTDRVYAFAFSPDGARLASGSNDATIRLWDAARGEAVGLLDEHSDYVFALAFSPDGTVLASASGDFTVRVWDTLARHVRAREAALRRSLRDGAREHVRQLSGELGTAREVASSLRADGNLGGEEREAAIQALLQEVSGLTPQD
ncbi:MAG TPA: protein kinase [Planctomycetota bacterium]|nr:protein kinase [Planctomycetota bacterium]